MRKKSFVALFVVIALSSFSTGTHASSEDTDTLSRTVWACKGTAPFEEFRTARLEGRISIVKAYIKNGLCIRLKKGTDVHVMGSINLEGGPEGELISVRRKGRFENLVTEKWYALSPRGSFRRLTGRVAP